MIFENGPMMVRRKTVIRNRNDKYFCDILALNPIVSFFVIISFSYISGLAILIIVQTWI